MSVVRLRRLTADNEKLKEYVRRHARVRLVQASGDPPESYQLEYRVRSLRMAGGQVRPVEKHLVELNLPLNYPRVPPQCRMLTPVFHPNIAPHAICVGDHWSPGESLQSIVTRIGEILAYQSYNTKSPLNGEAARWVEENGHLVPTDRVSMLVEDPGEATGDAAPPPASQAPQPVSQVTPPVRRAPPAPPVPKSPPERERPAPPTPATESSSALGTRFQCPGCGATYRANPLLAGRRIKCKKCETTLIVPGE